MGKRWSWEEDKTNPGGLGAGRGKKPSFGGTRAKGFSESGQERRRAFPPELSHHLLPSA